MIGLKTLSNNDLNIVYESITCVYQNKINKLSSIIAAQVANIGSALQFESDSIYTVWNNKILNINYHNGYSKK